MMLGFKKAVKEKLETYVKKVVEKDSQDFYVSRTEKDSVIRNGSYRFNNKNSDDSNKEDHDDKNVQQRPIKKQQFKTTREYNAITNSKRKTIKYVIDRVKLLEGIDKNFFDIVNYVENYDHYVNLISNHEPFNTLSLDDMKLVNSSSRVLMYNEDVLIPIINSLTPLETFKIDETEIDKDVSFLFNKNYITDYTKMKIHAGADFTFKPEIRYIPRYNYIKLKRRVKVLEPIYELIEKKIKNKYNVRLDEIELFNEYKTLKAILLMVEDLSLQLRFGSVAIQIKTILDLKQIRSEREFRSNLQDYNKGSEFHKRGIDLVAMQYIRKILAHYSNFPFHIKQGKILLHDNIDDLDIQLPIILMCLCNNAIHEYAGNLTAETAKISVKYLLDCAKVSVSNENLRMKSDLREWIKLAFSKIRRIGVIEYSSDGIPSGCVIKEISKRVAFPELWSEIAKKNLEVKCSSYPLYYKNWVNKQLEKITILCEQALTSDKTAYDLNLFFRDLIIQVNCITNFGIYHKTSLFLEYEKSLQPVQKVNIPTPKIKKVINTGVHQYPIAHFWDTLHHTFPCVVNYIFNNYKQHFQEFLLKNKLENIYVMFLTNRSGGIKAQDLDLPKKLKNVSSARIIKFALDRGSYEIKEEFMKNLANDGKCAIRFQNDRRSRLVVIVSNEIQTNEIFFLTFFNSVKPHDPWMAIGKQVGNISDAKIQLIYSSRLDLIKSNSDFKGMDTHTRPELTKALRNVIIELMHDILTESNPMNSKYFCFRDEEMQVETLDRDSNVVVSERCKISAPVNHSVHTLSMYYPTKMTLRDKFYNAEIAVSEQTFQSGFFATGANHTTFLTVITRVLQNNFLTDHSEYRNKFQLECLFMGDDGHMVMNSSPEIAIEWIEYYKGVLSEYNYEIDVDLSYFYSIFLQQAAFCGAYTPLPSRMSVLHDEKSDNLLNHPVDNIKIITQISRSYFQRSFCFENYVPFVMSVWNNIRLHRENLSNKLIETNVNQLIHHPDIPTSLEFLRFGYRNDIYYLFPYVLPFVSPISLPLQSMTFVSKDGDTYTNRRTMASSLQGDISYAVINQQFLTNRNASLFLINPELEVPLVQPMKKILDWEYRNRVGFTVSEFIVKFSRAVSLRSERLAEVGEDLIDSMSDVLREYLPEDKVYKSNLAIKKLAKKYIKVPDNLRYINLPKIRILQSLSANLEDEVETSIIDSRFLFYMLKYKKMPNGTELIKHALTLFRLLDDNTIDKNSEVEVSPDGIINTKIPYLPSYNYLSDFFFVLLYSATPLRYPNKVSGSIGEIHGELGTSFNVESAVDYGLYIYNKTRTSDDLRLLSAAMGMSEKVSAAYVELVLDASKFGLRTGYTSIFEHSVYFSISGWVELFTNKARLSTPFIDVPLSKKSATSYHQIFVRDMLFSFAKYLVKTKGLKVVESIVGDFSEVNHHCMSILLSKINLDISIYTNMAISNFYRHKLSTNSLIL